MDKVGIPSKLGANGGLWRSQVEQRKRVLQLAWNVTSANIKPGGNPRTVIYAPARQFFEVITVEQLDITLLGPIGSASTCRYRNPEQGILLSCDADKVGLYYLRVSPLPGIPDFLSSEMNA